MRADLPLLLLVGLAVLVYGAPAQGSPQAKPILQIPTLALERVRELIDPPGKVRVSAASGLVRRGTRIYAVSDDRSELFRWEEGKPGLSVIANPAAPIPPGEEGASRKATKPDFESLVALSAEEWAPRGAIVAWPSGSTLARMAAYVFPIGEDDEPGAPKRVDILPLAYRLNGEARELNVEGIVLRDRKVFLFQRGNGGKGKDGIFEMGVKGWLAGLRGGDWSAPLQFDSVKIGSLNGVRLTLSDAVWTSHGLLALASAEDTVSAYADGAVAGTALVRLVGRKATVLAKFAPVAKLEGMLVETGKDGALSLMLVDDADDPAGTSRVYRAEVPVAVLERVEGR